MRNVVSILIPLLALFLQLGDAAAQPKDISEWQRVASDIQLLQREVLGGPFSSGRFTAMRTQLGNYRLRVLRARDFSSSEMKAQELLDRTGAIAVMNANFFDELKHPLGLVIQNGILSQKPHMRGRTLTGMLLIGRDGVPRILHRQDFEPKNVEEGIQAGPRLVVAGEATTLRDAESWSLTRRSGICLLGERAILLFISEGIPTSMLQNLLIELQCKDALNLDGGSSSQMAIARGLPGARGDWKGLHIEGEDSVPVFLSITRATNDS